MLLFMFMVSFDVNIFIACTHHPVVYLVPDENFAECENKINELQWSTSYRPERSSDGHAVHFGFF